jgi:probable addiction module antidote protein
MSMSVAKMENTVSQLARHSVSHEDATVAALARDPVFASEYLNEVILDGDQQEFMLAMRRMAAASGGVSAIAQKAGLNAKTLYRTLSQTGNPELKSLSATLAAMGLQLAVRPLLTPMKGVSRKRARLGSRVAADAAITL